MSNEDVINTAVKGIVAIKILDTGMKLISDKRRRKPKREKGLL
jgi:hypothetical protein